MSVKSNGIQFSYTKALIFVALAAWLATNEATAGSPEDAMRGSRALDRQDAGHTDVSIKRYLRSNANMTSSNYAGSPEERASFMPSFTSSVSSLTASLKISLSRVIHTLQLWWRTLQLWWRGLRQKSPNHAFTRLGLDRAKAKLFESPAFFEWFAFLESRYPDSAITELSKILEDHYKEKAALIEVLVAGMNVERTKPIAEELLKIQLEMRENFISLNEFLTLLKLAETGDDLFQSPVFDMWVALVKKMLKDEEIANQMMYINLASMHNDEEVLAKALAKGIAADNPLAKKLEAVRARYQQKNDPKKTFSFLFRDQTRD